MIDSCDWNTPGHDRYTGSIAAAVASYKDIAAPTRAKLLSMMERHTYTDQVTIGRDSIRGARSYSDLRDMHFGASKRCASVSRTGWAQSMSVRALVYCADGECIAVPSICGNISRVTMFSSPVVAPTMATIEPVLVEVPALVEERAWQAPADDPQPVLLDRAVLVPVVVTVPMGVAVPVLAVPGIPEPETWLLMLSGLGLVFMKGRK